MSTFGDRYSKFCGALTGLAPDLARNHDLHLAAMKKPVKKTPVVKKKPILRAPAAIVRPSVLQILEVALAKTTEAGGLLGERLAELQVEPQILQDDLGAVLLFERVGKAADAPPKAFKDFAKALYEQREREAGQTDAKVRLDVEVGTRVLAWEDNRKVSPAWKEQAAKHAQILHAVAAAFARSDRAAMETLLAPFHGAFDQKVWEEAVRRITPKTGSLTPKIVEG